MPIDVLTLILLPLLTISCFGGMVGLVLTVRDLRGTLRERDLFIRQLLDRLATHEYAKTDGVIPRIFASVPPSIKENLKPRDTGVVGPHGGGQFEEVAKAKAPAPPQVRPKRPGGKRTLKLDVGEEFDPPGKQS